MIYLYFDRFWNSNVNSSASSENQEQDQNELCVICVKLKQGVHAFRPCGHALACLSCCIRLFEQNTSPMCPHCRNPIDSYLSVRLARNSQKKQYLIFGEMRNIS